MTPSDSLLIGTCWTNANTLTDTEPSATRMDGDDGGANIRKQSKVSIKAKRGLRPDQVWESLKEKKGTMKDDRDDIDIFMLMLFCSK